MRTNEHSLTPELVGRYLGVSAATVRHGMEDGSLPIGKVEKCNKHNRYTIYPHMLYKATGLKLNGYEPPAALADIDYEQLARCIVAELVKHIREAAT